MTKTVTLHCEAGNHSWEREAKRGKRPRNCPNHQPEAVAPKPAVEAKTEVVNGVKWVKLHCERGDHEWDRKSQRGKRPVNCPAHQAEADKEARAERATVEPTVKIKVDPTVVEALMQSHGVSRHIATAFANDGSEPPYQWQIDQRGLSSKEADIAAKINNNSFNPDDFEPII